MIIELVGAPASGKSYMLEECKRVLSDDRFVFLDIEYNKKNLFGKTVYLLKKSLGLLDSRYFSLQKSISRVQNDEFHKKFYRKQFRLDFILAKEALRLSKKSKIVVFSENLINLSKYIYFRKGNLDIAKNYKEFLYYINLLGGDLLKRDFVINIKVPKDGNIHAKARRRGVSPGQYDNCGGGKITSTE